MKRLASLSKQNILRERGSIVTVISISGWMNVFSGRN